MGRKEFPGFVNVNHFHFVIDLSPNVLISQSSDPRGAFSWIASTLVGIACEGLRGRRGGWVGHVVHVLYEVR